MEQIREDFQTLINHFLTMVEGDGLSDILLDREAYKNTALYEACVKHTHKIKKIDDMRRLAIDEQIKKISDIPKNKLTSYNTNINDFFKLDNNDTIDTEEFKINRENIDISTFYKLLDNITRSPNYGVFFVKINEEKHPYFYILPYTREITRYFAISMFKIQRDNLDNIDNMAIELDKLETMHRQFKTYYDDFDQNFYSMREIYNLPGLNQKEIKGFNDYRSY